ncbi:MAG: glycosyltransferase [Actinobacteria bacterium]|nr:glycosyltransferase [Actinomycetota bacterium]
MPRSEDPLGLGPRRLAILSMHTSPLAQPGTGDAGGMNVYVDSLSAALARAGVACDVYTRAEHPEAPPVVTLDGVRVHHVVAGPEAPVPKEHLPDLVEEFTDGVAREIESTGSRPRLFHANYWLSGVAGHALKHELELPLVSTFHTLARVRAVTDPGTSPELRARHESDTVRCSDLILASTGDEADDLRRLYDAGPGQVEVVPPGVDHTVFHPGDRAAARAALGLANRQVLLFAGRIQPLKGLELAVSVLARLENERAMLVVVGGPSGSDGPAELDRIRELVEDLAVGPQVRFVRPRPHDELADWYRAADVCLVPSRSESFGLVALEAAACGTPVVASAVGGLCSLVVDGETGFLVESRDPAHWVAPVSLLLSDRALAAELGASAEGRSRRYSWDMAAARLRRLYADLALRAPAECR